MEILNKDLRIIYLIAVPVAVALLCLTGDGWMAVARNIVFLISVWYLYDLLSGISAPGRVAFWITLLYSLFPLIEGWNNCIQTESLACSISVLLIWDFRSLTERMSWRSFLPFVCLLDLLVFISPLQFYYLPVFLVVFACLSFVKRSRAAGLLGLAGTLLVTAIWVLSPAFPGVVDQFAAGSGQGQGIKFMTHTGYYRLFNWIAGPLLEPVSIKFSEIYSVALVFFIVMCFRTVKGGRVPWLGITIVALLTANVLASVFFLPDDYGRFVLPSVPLWLLMLGYILSRIRLNYSNPELV